MSEPVYPTVDPAELEPEYSEYLKYIAGDWPPPLLWTGGYVQIHRSKVQNAAAQLALRDREIARLEGHRLAVAQKVGIVYQADFHAYEPGPDEIVIGTIDRLVFERDTVLARLEKSTDWYQQRFNRLRKWVEEEVRPLSEDTAHRYYAICANGSPAPHESADWTDTLHAARLERDAALGRVRELEGEAAAISDALMPASEWIGEAHSASEAVGNLARRVRELEGCARDADAVRDSLRAMVRRSL